MGQMFSREDSNSMKGTPEPQDPLTDTPELNKKYAKTDEKFSQLISQKEQVPTGDVIASSSIHSNNNLVGDLKPSDKVCQKAVELHRSLSSFSQLATEKEKAQLTFIKVAESQEDADKNKTPLEEDLKRQHTQLEEERATIIKKYGKELATLKDSLATKAEDWTTSNCRIVSLMEATETLQPEMRSLKQPLDSCKEIVETAPRGTLQYYEMTKNVAGNCSTSSSIMNITAEYNFEVARPKDSTNLRTTTADVEVHSLFATEKSMLPPIAVSATNERPAAARAYQRKIRARKLEAEAIAPHAKRSKIIESVELYRCDDCGKTYRQFRSLSIHIKEDCGKPSVECENCRITFQPFSYRIHTKIGVCRDVRRRNISMRNLQNILYVVKEEIVNSREVLRVDELILLLRAHTSSIDQ